MKTGRFVWVYTAMLILVLVISAIAPASSVSLAQGQTKTFRKPSWGLSLQYPADWSISKQDPYIEVNYGNETEGALFIMARDPAYADLSQDPQELFYDVMTQGGITENDVSDLQIDPMEGRTVAGADAQGYSVYFLFSGGGTEAEVDGYFYQFAKGNQGYVIFAAAATSVWDQYEPELVSIIDSLRISERAGPTPKPTPTPTRRKPTATPIRRKPTPTPTPEPMVNPLTTAREAYDLALPEAQQWSQDAALGKVECSTTAWEGDDRGRCAEWSFYFLQQPVAPPEAKGYLVIVADGQVDTDRTGEVDFWTAVPIDTEDWLDSPDAVQAFLNNGGVEFLIRNPDGGISNAEIPRGPVAGLELEHWVGEAHATWAVSAASNPDAPANGNVWWVLVDAQTAEVNATARQTEKFAQKYLTAHEALTVAQKVATKWQADAQLMEMLGWINYDDKMADTGKSGDWLLRFRSDSSDKVFSVSVADGKADTGTELDWPVTDPVTGKWFDSPVALKSFKFSDEYAAFSELFPDHEFTFWLKGDATLGYNWRMLASVAGVMLVSRTYVAEFEATETPAPTATVREATETPTVEATQTPTLPSTPVLTVTLAPAVSTVTVTLSTALTATPALTVTLPVTPAVKPAKAVTMTVTVTAPIRPTPIVTPTQVVTPTTPAETATPQRRRRA